MHTSREIIAIKKFSCKENKLLQNWKHVGTCKKCLTVTRHDRKQLHKEQGTR